MNKKTDAFELVQMARALITIERYRKKWDFPGSNFIHLTYLVEVLAKALLQKHQCEHCGKDTNIYVDFKFKGESST